MKILYLITKSNYGGAQKYTYELATAAQKQGYEVLVAAGGTGDADTQPGVLAEKLSETGVRFYFIKNFVRNVSPLRDLHAAYEIYRLFRQEKPDVLHLSSSKSAGIGAVVAKICRIPRVVYTIHGLPEEETWRPDWQRKMIKLLTDVTIRFSHIVITINTETHDWVRARVSSPEKIHKIFNGITTQDFLPKSTALQEVGLSLPETAKVIGGIGELHPNKNWRLLLHVLTDLPKEVHLVIIGEGEERDRLENLREQLGLQQRVHFLGYRNEASRLLSLFDIYVLPSKKEGLPYVLLEAGLARLPVVATDLPGVRDIVTTGETGMTVPPEKNSFSAALTMLLREQHMQTQLAEALHNKIITTFSLAKMLAETFATYDMNSESLETTDA